MEIDRIKLSEEVNVFGRHFWAGFEAALNEKDDPIECMKQLQDKIEKFCNPTINITQAGTHIRIINEIPEKDKPNESPIESTIDAINSCTEIKVLESYKFIVKGNPEYQQAYSKKLIALTRASIKDPLEKEKRQN